MTDNKWDQIKATPEIIYYQAKSEKIKNMHKIIHKIK